MSILDESRYIALHIGEDFRRTLSACPTVWEGTLIDGTYMHVRYRSGKLTIRIGGTNGEEAYAYDPIVTEDIGEDWNGVLEWSEARPWIFIALYTHFTRNPYNG